MDDPFEQLLGTIFLSSSNPIGESLSIIVAFLIVLILLCCSALISGSEVAYFSLSPNDQEEMNPDTNRRHKMIHNLLDRPKKLLATILIANNFVNVAIVILSSYLSDLLISDQFSDRTQFILKVIVITFILLLIGEVIPKIYANKNSLKLASFMSFPIYYMRAIFSPLSNALVSSTNFIDKRFKKKGHNISVDELSQALELTTDDNEKEEDQKILEGIVKFGNTDVKQVMTSRVDVVSIEVNSSFQEVLEIILDSGYSRIPVHKDNFDTVMGILFIKDVLPHLAKKDFDWKSIIRKPYFVPENKKIDDLLKEFQSMKTHQAIVVDEYGGSSGIISLEDILEEIVGEISDEFDDDDLVYSKLDEYNYVFEGKTPLNDMYRVLDIDGQEFESGKGESETLAGLVLELFGKIPQKNERIKFHDYQLTVEAADRRRVKRIKLTLPKKVEEEKE